MILVTPAGPGHNWDMAVTRDRQPSRQRTAPERARPRGGRHERRPSPVDAEPRHTGERQEAPGPRAAGRRFRRAPAGLGYLPIFILLACYFVWLCTQMAGHAPGGIGGSSLVAIGVAMAAGVIAAGAAMLFSRRRG